MGMLSYQRIVCPHAVQRERGVTMDSWLGRREMQTFRKLPNSSPGKNPANSKKKREATPEVYVASPPGEFRTAFSTGFLDTLHRIKEGKKILAAACPELAERVVNAKRGRICK